MKFFACLALFLALASESLAVGPWRNVSQGQNETREEVIVKWQHVASDAQKMLMYKRTMRKWDYYIKHRLDDLGEQENGILTAIREGNSFEQNLQDFNSSESVLDCLELKERRRLMNETSELGTRLETSVKETEVEEKFSRYRIRVGAFIDQMEECRKDYTVAMNEKKFELLQCVSPLNHTYLAFDFEMENEIGIMTESSENITAFISSYDRSQFLEQVRGAVYECNKTCDLVPCEEVNNRFDFIMGNLTSLYQYFFEWSVKIDSIWRCQNRTEISVGGYANKTVCDCDFLLSREINHLHMDMATFNDVYYNATEVFGMNICNNKIC